jgi:hypothetical protein
MSLLLRRIQAFDASCGTIRPQAAQDRRPVRVSVRRIKIAMASACPTALIWADCAFRLNAAATARGSPA